MTTYKVLQVAIILTKCNSSRLASLKYPFALSFWLAPQLLCELQLRNNKYSDARLFCKNKQVNLKNKAKIGNLTEKQANMRLARKFSKKKNRQEN